MAAAFPDVVRSALDAADEPAMDGLRELRGAMEAGGQFIAAAKHALGRRGVPIRTDMRAPLRPLTAVEAEAFEAAADALPGAGSRLIGLSRRRHHHRRRGAARARSRPGTESCGG